MFLNGKSLGTKPRSKNESPREWDITFEKGTIKTIGKNNGREVASEAFESAGAPAKIKLTTSRAGIANNWDDVSIVTAQIIDAKGIPCPNADNSISFEISGIGAIAAVDNGNVLSYESYRGNQRKAFKGKAIAIIRATGEAGKIAIKAGSEGLTAGEVMIDVKQ